MIEATILKKCEGIINKEFLKFKKNEKNLSQNDLYRMMAVSLLCLLLGDKKYYSYFMYNLIKHIDLIPHTYSIQFSVLQITLLCEIGTIKFNDFHSLSKQLHKSMVHHINGFLSHIDKNTFGLFVDSVKGPLPFISYLIEFDKGWKQDSVLLENYLSYIDIDTLYKNKLSLDMKTRELFPKGYLDLSRAHGLLGLVSLLGKIKKFNLNLKMNDGLIDSINKVLNLCYMKENGVSLWAPYLVKENDGKYYNKAIYDIVCTQRFCWCTGSLGAQLALSSYITFYGDKEMIQQFNSVSRLIDNPIYLPSDNKFICHGYSGAYLIAKSLNKNKDLSKIKKEISNTFLNCAFDDFSNYHILDGEMSCILSLLSCENENDCIRSALRVFYMQE